MSTNPMDHESDPIDLLTLVQQMREGDSFAKEELARNIYARLEAMARKMLRTAPRAVVRWDQTGDLLHTAWFRIERALEDPSLSLKDEAHLFRLIARHLRFQLIEIYRRNVGTFGLDANHGSVAGLVGEEGSYASPLLDPSDRSGDVIRLLAWGEFHQQVEQLPEREKAVTDLLWYQGLKQEKVADLLGTNVKAVQRAWRSAKIQLGRNLDPGILGD